MKKFKLPTIKCKRCGHEWSPRVKEVRMCAKCKTPYFDKAKPKGDQC